MAQQILIFPDGQRVNPQQVASYSVTTSQLGWVFQSGGTGLFNGYGTNAINYNNLLRIVDIVIASGVDGFYNLAQLAGYTITSISPSIIHSNGVTASITVYGTGFDNSMVGNTINIEDLTGPYDGNDTIFTISTIVSSIQLTATWTTDGGGAAINTPDFAYYTDSNGYLFGRLLGVSIVNP